MLYAILKCGALLPIAPVVCRLTMRAIAEWFKDTPVGSPRQCTDFVGQWREELLASCGRNFIEDQLAEGQLAIEAWSLRGLPRPPPQDRQFPLRVSCEYSGRAGGAAAIARPSRAWEAFLPSAPCTTRAFSVSVSQHFRCSSIKSTLLTSHPRKLGSVFEGPGGRAIVLKRFAKWGWAHERQRTKQANTGANAKQEANRDNEAKSAQTKSRQTIKSRVPGRGAG